MGVIVVCMGSLATRLAGAAAWCWGACARACGIAVYLGFSATSLAGASAWCWGASARARVCRVHHGVLMPGLT